MYENASVLRDYWAVAIHFDGQEIDPQDEQYVDKVMSVYFFDKSKHVHCCSWTPSYELNHLEDVIWFKDNCPEDLKDEFEQKYCYGDTPHVEYMNVSEVDNIPNERRDHYNNDPEKVFFPEDYTDEEADNDVRDYYQGNCPF